MKIRLNGESYPIVDGIENLYQLLEHLRIEKKMVMLEHNRCAIRKEDSTSIRLSNGDIVEVVEFVGGG